MHSCYIEPDKWHVANIEISSQEEHHLLDVCRAKPGEEVRFFNGIGDSMTVRIKRIYPKKTASRNRVEFDVLTTAGTAPKASGLTLFQAIPKGDNLFWIIQKSTELGVARIVPMLTDRVIKRPFDKDRHFSDRLRKTAIEAAKQSGSNYIPEITEIMDVEKSLGYIKKNDYDVVFFGAIGIGAKCFKEAVKCLAGGTIRNIALLIGPEGDFTGEEIHLISASGAIPVSFGETILKVETASFYGISILKHEFGF